MAERGSEVLERRQRRGQWQVASLAALVAILVTTVSIEAAPPADIAGHWAEPELRAWVEAGILRGYDDGTLRPDAPVTRAEFAALANRALGLVGGDSEPRALAFADVSACDWFARDIGIAVNAGYMRGYEAGSMRPLQPVTREQAAVMLARLLPFAGDAGNGDDPSFRDQDRISGWGEQAVAAVARRGLMHGDPDGNFRPQAPMTRAEAVVTLERARQSARWFAAPGTYGPATGMEVVDGSVVVTAAGVTLRNLVITGELALAAGIGDGDVTLQNVVVKGPTTVRAGGSNSIHVIDTRLFTVIVDDENGNVRIVASGATEIGDVQLRSGAILEEEGLSGVGFGNLSVQVAGDGRVILAGVFHSVEMALPNLAVELQSGSIDVLHVLEGGEGAQIRVNDDATVGTLILDATARATGGGRVERVQDHTHDSEIDDALLAPPGTGGNGGDGAGSKGPGTSNRAPVVVAGAERQTGMATPAAANGNPPAVPYVADMGGWFSDADGDLLTYTLVEAVDGNAQDVSADVTISGEQITYTPRAAQANGTVTLVVNASDGRAVSSGTVTITVSVGAVPAPVPDATPPVFVSAVVGNVAPERVVVTFTEPVTVSGASGFTVQINGSPVAISAVSGSGSDTFTFTLAMAVQPGDTVTLSYDGSGDAADLAGNPLTPFSGASVTNNVRDDVPPAFLNAVVQDAAASEVEAHFSEPVTVSGASGFTVKINGSPVAISAVSGSGTSTLTFTLASPVRAGDTVTLSYDGSGDAADLAGNPLPTFADGPVAVLAPLFESALVGNAAPSEIVATFTEALSVSSPAGFHVKINGAEVAITAVSGSLTNQLTFTLATAVQPGDTVTLSYDGSGNAQTSSGRRLVSFTDEPVRNNTSDTTPPAFVSAVVEDAAPSEVVITFSEPVKVFSGNGIGVKINGVSAGFSVSSGGPDQVTLILTGGRTVQAGQTVTVSYNGTGSIKDLAGNNAANFTDQPVTNNVR